MRHMKWSDAVRRFLASSRNTRVFHYDNPRTAKQTAWRLRKRFGSVVEVHARDGRVILGRRT